MLVWLMGQLLSYIKYISFDKESPEIMPSNCTVYSSMSPTSLQTEEAFAVEGHKHTYTYTLKISNIPADRREYQ